MPACDWLENLSEDPYFRGLQDKVPAGFRRTFEESEMYSRDGKHGIMLRPPIAGRAQASMASWE